MTRVLQVLLIVALFSGAAKAQDFLTLARQLCQTANQEWVCHALQLPGQVESLLGSFHGDMANFGRGLLDGWLRDAMATLGARIDSQQLEQIVNRVSSVIGQGPGELRRAIEQAVGELHLSNLLAPRSPRYSPDWWGEQAELANPNLMVAGELARAQQERALVVQTEAAAVQEANLQLAREVQEATAAREAVARVTLPQAGAAAQLESRARTATSTRAAIVHLTEGLAELMRQEAVFSGTIIEHLRILSQQQVKTTWQLQLAVNTLTEQMSAEAQARQAALQQRVRTAYSEGQQFAQTIEAVGGRLTPVMGPGAQLDRLRWSELQRMGW
jgi:FtsZ-binding cell division protein ZapB